LRNTRSKAKFEDLGYITVKKKKLNLSRYTPWRHMWGEEV
jgi:hypothetical protein